MATIDAGLSASGSSSAGASHSGALGIDTSAGFGGNFGGTNYGPGSLVQAQGLGASTGGGLNWVTIAIFAGIGLLVFYFITRRKK